LFTKFGSDKSALHNYHHLYAEILKDKDHISHVLEIGVGTNNLDVVCNMGAGGVPGASLRAFREYLPNATIFGADLDKRILFQEDRIHTYFVDQTDLASLESLGRNIPHSMDLIIDDGLHSPNANLAVLAFGLKRLKNRGWLVIEDIPERAVPVWELVAALLPDTFASKCCVTRQAWSLLFNDKTLQPAPTKKAWPPLTETLDVWIEHATIWRKRRRAFSCISSSMRRSGART